MGQFSSWPPLNMAGRLDFKRVATMQRRLDTFDGGVPAHTAEATSDDEPVYGTNTDCGIAANRQAEVFIDF
jgi:hypothetical protein